MMQALFGKRGLPRWDAAMEQWYPADDQGDDHITDPSPAETLADAPERSEPNEPEPLFYGDPYHPDADEPPPPEELPYDPYKPNEPEDYLPF